MKASYRYFRFFKPYGFLSQFHSNDPKEVRKAKMLSHLPQLPEGLMPVGRLDKDSEGLLLLTDDGGFSNRINSTEVAKTYLVTVDGIIGQTQIDQLLKGVTLLYNGKPFLARALEATLIEKLPEYLPQANPRIRLDAHRKSSNLKLIVNTGKFRQIRKMTAAIGFPTLRLIRIQIGSLGLEGLSEGEFSPFTIEEI